MDETLETWFKREILAHEAALVRYLTRLWPNRDDIHDLRQEIYIRVYEAAKKSRPTVSAKSFLFSTARNLMTDRVRRSRIVSIEAVGDFDSLHVMVDEVSPERRLDGRQELKRVAAAFDALPPKCREVFWMRRVDELTQKEVAERLGISPRTVEKHVVRGMQILADIIFGRAEGTARQSDPVNRENSESEPEHGQQQTD